MGDARVGFTGRRKCNLFRGLCENVFFSRQGWRFTLLSKGIPSFPFFEGNQGAVQALQHPLLGSNSKYMTFCSKLENIDIHNNFCRKLVPEGAHRGQSFPYGYQNLDILIKFQRSTSLP